MSIVTCAAYKSRKFDYMLFNFGGVGGVGGVDYKPVDYKHSVMRSACQAENTGYSASMAARGNGSSTLGRIPCIWAMRTP